jgi:hypothetical protein
MNWKLQYALYIPNFFFDRLITVSKSEYSCEAFILCLLFFLPLKGALA